jgi:hypothetical protein
MAIHDVLFVLGGSSGRDRSRSGKCWKNGEGRMTKLECPIRDIRGLPESFGVRRGGHPTKFVSIRVHLWFSHVLLRKAGREVFGKSFAWQ